MFKLQGVIKMADVLAQDEEASEILLRATRDNDFRWVSKSRSIDCARAVRMFGLIREWLGLLDKEDVERMARCVEACSFRVAESYLEDQSERT